MDCSLGTLIQQVDDSLWSGLADIDRLGNLDQFDSRLLRNEVYSLLSDSEFQSEDNILAVEGPALFLKESIEDYKWQNINASELASVLDDTFPPPESVTSGPAMDDTCHVDVFVNLDVHSNESGYFFVVEPHHEPIQLTDVAMSSWTDTSTLLGWSARSASSTDMDPYQNGTIECILSTEDTTIPSMPSEESQSGEGGSSIDSTSHLLDDNSADSCVANVSFANLRRAGAKSKTRRAKMRRLRVEQRTKKYPLNKFIHMPSVSEGFTSTNQSSSIIVPAEQTPLHGVLPSADDASGSREAVDKDRTITDIPEVIQDIQAVSTQPLLSNLVLQSSSLVDQRLQFEQQSTSSYGESQSVQQPLEGSSRLPNISSESGLALLTQLQSVVNELNLCARLCIRDSLYRLAKNAKQRQLRTDERGQGSSSGNVSDFIASYEKTFETQTNPIDRRIVNLLFCTPSSVSDVQMQPCSYEAVNQQSPDGCELWHSCLSFLNLQDQPPHTVSS